MRSIEVPREGTVGGIVWAVHRKCNLDCQVEMQYDEEHVALVKRLRRLAAGSSCARARGCDSVGEPWHVRSAYAPEQMLCQMGFRTRRGRWLVCDVGVVRQRRSNESGATDTELLDAADVNKERAEASSTTMEYGVPADYEGVSVAIDSPKWGESFTSGDNEYGSVTMDVLFENRSDVDVESPLITIHCESAEGYYSNQHSGPIDPFDPLPSGTKAEGQTETNVTLPCEDGWIQWEPAVFDKDVPTFRWALPAP